MADPTRDEGRTLVDDLSWALDTIIWMSAASDFVEGGQAHDGWIEVRTRLNEVLKRKHADARPAAPAAPATTGLREALEREARAVCELVHYADGSPVPWMKGLRAALEALDAAALADEHGAAGEGA